MSIRHRARSARVVTGWWLLVAVAACLITMIGPSAVATAATTNCPTMRVFGVRGSGETQSDYGGYGETVYDAIQEIYAQDPSTQISPINYEAVGVEPLNPKYDFGGYAHSVQTGDTALAKAINDWIAGPCGKTTYVYLIGYSQGAEVAGDVYQRILSPGARARVQGVALIGDPLFNPGRFNTIFATSAVPSGVDVGNYNKYLDGILAPFSDTGDRDTPSSQAAIVRDYCHSGDPVCNYSASNAIFCKVESGTCAHTTYFDEQLNNSTTYTVAAGDFLVSRWRTVGPNIVRTGSRTSILFYGNGGDYTDTGGFSNLEGALVSAGYNVHFSTSLPANLSSYGQVWMYGLGVITTSAEEQELINYARAGGSLFLTGEWSYCCQTPTNDSAVGDIFDSLVVTVGGMQLGPDIGTGPVGSVNPDAIDGIATTPTKLTTFTAAAAGTISATNIDPSNFVFTDVNGNGIVGAWDDHDVTGGGRLVIVMDTNWIATQYEDPTTVPGIVQNIAYFLSGGITP